MHPSAALCRLSNHDVDILWGHWNLLQLHHLWIRICLCNVTVMCLTLGYGHLQRACDYQDQGLLFSLFSQQSCSGSHCGCLDTVQGSGAVTSNLLIVLLSMSYKEAHYQAKFFEKSHMQDAEKTLASPAALIVQ